MISFCLAMNVPSVAVIAPACEQSKGSSSQGQGQNLRRCRKFFWIERVEKMQLSQMTYYRKEEETVKRRRGAICKQKSFQDKVHPTTILPFKSLLINTKLKILLETSSWPSPWEIKI